MRPEVGSPSSVRRLNSEIAWVSEAIESLLPQDVSAGKEGLLKTVYRLPFAVHRNRRPFAVHRNRRPFAHGLALGRGFQLFERLGRVFTRRDVADDGLQPPVRTDDQRGARKSVVLLPLVLLLAVQPDLRGPRLVHVADQVE